MNTTLRDIRSHRPCATGWATLLQSKPEETVSFAHILTSNGLADACWCLRTLPVEKTWLFNIDMLRLLGGYDETCDFLQQEPSEDLAYLEEREALRFKWMASTSQSSYLAVAMLKTHSRYSSYLLYLETADLNKLEEAEALFKKHFT